MGSTFFIHRDLEKTSITCLAQFSPFCVVCLRRNICLLGKSRWIVVYLICFLHVMGVYKMYFGQRLVYMAQKRKLWNQAILNREILIYKQSHQNHKTNYTNIHFSCRLRSCLNILFISNLECFFFAQCDFHYGNIVRSSRKK